MAISKKLSFRSNVDVKGSKWKFLLTKIIPSVFISSSQELGQSALCDIPIEVQSAFQVNKKRKKLTPIERLEREVFIQSLFYVAAS
jgi:hypothetical protein